MAKIRGDWEQMAWKERGPELPLPSLKIEQSHHACHFLVTLCCPR